MCFEFSIFAGKIFLLFRSERILFFWYSKTSLLATCSVQVIRKSSLSLRVYSSFSVFSVKSVNSCRCISLFFFFNWGCRKPTEADIIHSVFRRHSLPVINSGMPICKIAVSLTLASTDQREVHKMYFRKRNPLKNLRGSLYPIGVDQRRKCEM